MVTIRGLLALSLAGMVMASSSGADPSAERPDAFASKLSSWTRLLVRIPDSIGIEDEQIDQILCVLSEGHRRTNLFTSYGDFSPVELEERILLIDEITTDQILSILDEEQLTAISEWTPTISRKKKLRSR